MANPNGGRQNTVSRKRDRAVGCNGHDTAVVTTKKTKTPYHDSELPLDVEKWNCLSPMYFLRNDRLTRGKLRRDMDGVANEASCSQNIVNPVEAKKNLLRVYEVKCRLDYFPLLRYNCTLANDIVDKYNELENRKGRKDITPEILQTDQLVFTVITDGDIIHDLGYMVRKDNVPHTHYDDITENVTPDMKMKEVEGSCCCVIFQHSEVQADVKAKNIIRASAKPPHPQQPKKDVREIECEMTEKGLRKCLTDFLSGPLFSYAENMVRHIHELARSRTRYSKESIQQIEQAALALLNRSSNNGLASANAGKIPDEVSLALIKLCTQGVLAFGLFSTGLVVFVDENTTREQVEKVTNACRSLQHEPKIVYACKYFLKPTSGTQGDKLINETTNMAGTLGMVTRARIKSKSAPGLSCEKGTVKKGCHRKQEEKTEVCVGLTSGHYFKEGHYATCYFSQTHNEPKRFGQCIASLQLPTDIAVIKVEKEEHCSLNFYDEEGKLCNCVPMRRDMQINDLVYKRGAMTKLTKGYIHSPDFYFRDTDSETTPLCDMRNGYLIQGKDGNLFADKKDSGSVVFCPDPEDYEKETVQIISIQSSNFDEEKIRKLDADGIPLNISLSVRADKCFEKLRVDDIEIILPTKNDME